MLGALGNVIRALGNVDSALETLERGPEQLEQQIGDELHRRALAHFDPVSVAEKQATKQGRSKVAGWVEQRSKAAGSTRTASYVFSHSGFSCNETSAYMMYDDRIMNSRIE